MCVYLKTRVIFIGSFATEVSYLKSKITLNVKSLLAHMPGMLMQVVSSRFLRSLSARQKPRRVFQGSHMWEKKETRQENYIQWHDGGQQDNMITVVGLLRWEQRVGLFASKGWLIWKFSSGWLAECYFIKCAFCDYEP